MFRRKPSAPTLPPEWIFVGLGNPGPQYAHTRHNVGFDLIDHLAEAAKHTLKTRKHSAVYEVVPVAGVPCLLVKPMTFMNLSGQAVSPILKEFRLGLDRLVVITDELDLPVGDAKFSPKGSAGGHNGHKSLIATLGSTEYARIKIGIGKGEDETIDHVLGRFRPEDRVDVNKVIARVAECLETVALHGIDRGIAELNRQRPR
ncbi:MAG: aminoacyl-tRNA hydrolase [Chthonomonas sp.]|nr:aminoacyl-tRNA hydrolase [Chthonomonas sp.]